MTCSLETYQEESFQWQVYCSCGFGCKIMAAFFLPTVLPSSTGVPVVSAVQSAEVMISWGPPSSDGGSPITHYIVESRVASTYGTFPAQAGANWVTAIGSVSDNNTIVASLHPFTRYEFRVTSVNLAGRGPPSSSSNIITTQEAGK